MKDDASKAERFYQTRGGRNRITSYVRSILYLGDDSKIIAATVSAFGGWPALNAIVRRQAKLVIMQARKKPPCRGYWTHRKSHENIDGSQYEVDPKGKGSDKLLQALKREGRGYENRRRN